MRLSPEGDRIAFSIESDGGAQSGVAIIGICRDHDGSVAGLSQAFALVSTQSNVSMMTFYNDVTFLYATQYDLGVARTVDGSLDGAWTIADSQVTSLSVQ